MKYEFLIVDVFTETAFGGNQLAVFPMAVGMSADAMQKIAREFNFAETTFVTPPTSEEFSARVRIFTPKRELPFAGHPTVGTAAALAHLGRLQPNLNGGYKFEEGIGPVTVRVGGGEYAPVFAELEVQAELQLPADIPDSDALSRALRLPRDSIADCWFAAIGIPFCFIELRNRDLVDAASLDRGVWTDEIADTWAPQLFLFSGGRVPGAKVYARMFAPALGIDEDPATGSACVTLIASLATKLGATSDISVQIDQGVKMGRPSSMTATTAGMSTGRPSYRVGGGSVIVARGVMEV
jgi:trans-2,3-dihydro-3-hydroxyanthranilate isomerase